MQHHPLPCWRHIKHSPERPRHSKNLICKVSFSEQHVYAAHQMLRVKCQTLPKMRTPSWKWCLMSICLDLEVYTRFFAHSIAPWYFSSCDTWHTVNGTPEIPHESRLNHGRPWEHILASIEINRLTLEVFLRP